METPMDLLIITAIGALGFGLMLGYHHARAELTRRLADEQHHREPPCTACGGPMVLDPQPGDILTWRRCGRCRRQQVAVPRSNSGLAAW
jgi:hypothetical protein